MVKRIAVMLLALAFLMPVASAVQAQAETGSYYFEIDGDITLSGIELDLFAGDNGNYVAMVTFTPSQDEINALLDEGSHVDFQFTFSGLEASGDTDFAPGVSDYIRQSGAIVEAGPSGPIYTAFGLNTESRWVAGESITVMAPIFRYEPGDTRPTVSVDLISSTWYFPQGGCEIVYERTTNNETLSYCAEQGQRSALVDEYGDTEFRFD